MKKKMLSIVAALGIISLAIIIPLLIQGGGNTLLAKSYRDGFLVQPEKEDETGIAVDTSFIFSWEDAQTEISKEEVAKNMSISTDKAYTVEALKDTDNYERGYRIVVREALEKNTIYTIKYKNITWTYKTQSDFQLIGTLPRNTSSSVPLNTGIELIFNHKGAKVDEYFEITPEVKGSFTQVGRTVVFMPKELEEKTIYTVTLKKGLPLDGTEQTLKEDYVFSFETDSKENSENDIKGHISLPFGVQDFLTTEVPKVKFDYYVYDEKAYDEKAKVKIYAYNSAENFLDAIYTFGNLPTWSDYAMEDNYVATDAVENVMEFSYELKEEQDYPSFMELPEKLPAGYYLVDMQWKNVHAQGFIQVTDLGFYYNHAKNGDVLWVHNMVENKPVEGAKVNRYFAKDSEEIDKQKDGEVVTGTSDKNGVVNMLTDRIYGNTDTMLYHITSDGKEAVLFHKEYSYYWRNSESKEDMYWQYFQTDRTLYKPDDSVEFFGFLQNRYKEEEIKNVKVEISSGDFYYWSYLPYLVNELSYEDVDVAVENGFFKGALELPNLEEGSYQIRVVHDDDILINSYIKVENYIKPAYKMEIEKDKKAIFTDEKVAFTVSTKFFEGTPVANLDLTYNYSDNVDYFEKEEKTDVNGNKKVVFSPKYSDGLQGSGYGYFRAYASLPETGQIYGNEQVQIFYNDVEYTLTTKVEESDGTFDVIANKIDLTKINNETAKEYKGYLGEVVPDKKVEVIVYRNEWVKEEVGEYYDYINKEVRKRYNYSTKTDEYTRFTVTTDKEGKASKNLSLPKEENIYYTADVTATDLKNRKMTFKQYFNKKYKNYTPYERGYEVTTDKAAYGLGEEIQLDFTKNETSIGKGQFLYITAVNGIVDVIYSDDAKVGIKYKKEHVPNIAIQSIYFNGKTHIKAHEKNVRYDYDEKDIQVSLTLDKKGYKPGDEVEVKIVATNKHTGEVIPNAKVNLGLIDEALLALSDQEIQPLEMLYRFVPSGLYGNYSSHTVSENAGNFNEKSTDAMMLDAGRMTRVSMAMDSSKNYGVEENTSVKVRSEFKDTAIFTLVTLDEKGEGTLKFTLPDNVTSWRFTAVALNEDLSAGSKAESVNVSLPMFINTSMSTHYLVGDTTAIGISAYGSKLTADTSVVYTVEIPETKEVFTATGKAFERVNIALPSFEKAGTFTFEVKAVATLPDYTKISDGVEYKVEVVDSFHMKGVTNIYNLQAGDTLDKIKTTSDKMTSLVFTDQGKAMYLSELYHIAYTSGKRIDQQYFSNLAKDMLHTKFGESLPKDEVVLTKYMNSDGGFAILPYAESDVETTVTLLPFLMKEKVSTEKTRLYLENLYYSEQGEKGAILYGLAVLNEPVIQELNEYAAIDNLTRKDTLYIARAYATLGDTYTATLLYTKAIDEAIEEYAEVASVTKGLAEQEGFEVTALAMITAQELDIQTHEKFYQYMTKNNMRNVLKTPYMYTYIEKVIENTNQVDGKVSYTYNGKTHEIELGTSYGTTIKLPSQKIKDVSITKVEGSVAVAVTYEENISTIYADEEKDKAVKVTRKYYDYVTNEEKTTFEQGDIVKVEMSYEIKKEAIDTNYIIKDYAPAGLKPISNPRNLGIRAGEDGYTWYRDVEGQEVTFHVYKKKVSDQVDPTPRAVPTDIEGEFLIVVPKEPSEEPSAFADTKGTLTYYARIAATGSYTAEPAIMRGEAIQDSVTSTEAIKIVIQ